LDQGPGLLAQRTGAGKGIQDAEKCVDFPLIFTGYFRIVRAMFKIIVFIISIAWASLLLVSWGGTTEVPAATVTLERSGN
jgi:hypothetical protein